MRTGVGRHDYMAPEMIWGNCEDMDDEKVSPFTVAVDIWSLGCALFRLPTQQIPFISPSSLIRYYRSKVSFLVDALNQNSVRNEGFAILSKMMKPRPID